MCNCWLFGPFHPLPPSQRTKMSVFWAFVLLKQCSFATAAPIYARSSLLEPSRVLDVQRPIHWPVLAIMGPVHSIFRIGYFRNGGVPVISTYRKCHVKDETTFKSSYLYHGISQSIRWRLYIESAPRPLCFDRTVPIWCHLVMTAVDLQRTVHVVIWYYNLIFLFTVWNLWFTSCGRKILLTKDGTLSTWIDMTLWLELSVLSSASPFALVWRYMLLSAARTVKTEEVCPLN